MDVAIKEISLQKGSFGKVQQQAFKREVEVMSQVNHDNLVRLYGIVLPEADAKDAKLCLVTEFCAGGSLFDFLHEGDDEVDLTWSQQLKMCRDVAQGMFYLHSCDPQIIHRDLKSANLLLTAPVKSPKDEVLVKVSDFGLARMKERDAGWQTLTSAAGTAHWMAPEVPSGRYTEKADVYSYAMVVFEILSKEVPFEDSKAQEVLTHTRKGDRPDMDAIPPDVPVRLQEIMKVSWAQEPSERPAFEVILKELEKVKVP